MQSYMQKVKKHIIFGFIQVKLTVSLALSSPPPSPLQIYKKYFHLSSDALSKGGTQKKEEVAKVKKKFQQHIIFYVIPERNMKRNKKGRAEKNFIIIEIYINIFFTLGK